MLQDVAAVGTDRAQWGCARREGGGREIGGVRGRRGQRRGCGDRGHGRDPVAGAATASRRGAARRPR